MKGLTRVDHVTCLGCGCCCDDISITVVDASQRIAELERACPLGREWFERGASAPRLAVVTGQPTALDAALERAARMLSAAAGRVLVLIGTDVSTEAVRAALALADHLGAFVDTSTTEAAARGILAAQRRGRAAATLGEIRNRADAVVFWAVDPMLRYPRFAERYAPEPVGTHVPDGRRGRRVTSVSIGAATYAAADEIVTLAPTDELAALAIMRAIAVGHTIDAPPGALTSTVELVRALASAKYVGLIYDAEDSAPHARDRGEALIALTQALNRSTRAALIGLRGGGNRNGAEAALTWQAGYPFAVDFARGFPRYTPDERGWSGLATGRFDAALVVGDVAGLPDDARGVLGTIPAVAIGPGASAAGLSVTVAIDTGVAGIHDGGTAYRMDDVPLSLRPSLAHPASSAVVLASLLASVGTVR